MILIIPSLLMEYRPVAQLAERRSPKPKVGGSMPSWPAKKNLVVEEKISDTVYLMRNTYVVYVN